MQSYTVHLYFAAANHLVLCHLLLEMNLTLAHYAQDCLSCLSMKYIQHIQATLYILIWTIQKHIPVIGFAVIL